MIKYLYGDFEKLSPFIRGEKGLRFSDLSHYARLENELIMDEELIKKFLLDPTRVKISVSGYELHPSDIVGNVEVSIPTINSYSLCLSGRGNCKELYSRFQANVCLEIDVEKLVEFVGALKMSFPGMEIEHGEVQYFDPCRPVPTSDPFRLAFYKPQVYSPENEYRVLIRLPMNRTEFLAVSGKRVPFFIPGESMHMEFTANEAKHNNACLLNVYRP